MKKLLILLILLSHSFFAMAENKWDLLYFIKDNALDVAVNNIQYSVEDLSFSHMKSITSLKIYDKDISELPNEIYLLKSLRSLSINRTNLKKLPDSFMNLKELVNLSLSNNKLEELPKNFFSNFKNPFVSYLGAIWPGVTLDISNNRISHFDKSICEVNRIYQFNFYNNHLDSFPNCTNSMPSGVVWYISSKFGSSVAPGNIFTDGYDSNNVDMKEFIEKAGWEVSKDVVIINYSFESNKTISFDYILGDDINITSYLWNFGDGNISTNENPTYSYSNYGDYNITLTLNKGEFNISKLITIEPRVLELTKGWNMITPPTKDDIDASIFEKVWSYDWSYYNSQWNSNHSFLIPTVGYWVKLNEDLNYSYSGEVYKLPNYKIKEGWNLVGSGEKYFKEDDNLTLWSYKNNEWFLNPKEINIGSAFWIKK